MNYFARNKFLVMAFVVLITLNVATLTTFWLLKEKRTDLPVTPRSGVLDFLVKELQFDSVQKQKLMQLREKHQQQIMDIRKENRELKDAFFELLQQPDIADSAVEKAAQASLVYDVQAEIFTFRHFQQIRSMCSDAQKKKFDAIIKQVLRMMAPPQRGGPQRQPPRMEEGPPPPGETRRDPPPPIQE